MEFDISNFIKKQIDKSKSKNIYVFSVDNLKMKCFVEEGEEIKKELFKKNLKKEERLLQINSHQFILKDSITNYMEESIFENLIIEGKYDELVEKTCKVVENNYPIFKVNKKKIFDRLKENETPKINLTELVNKFNEYYNNRKKAVQIDSLVNVYFKDSNISENQILDIVIKNPMFYRLTKKKFALKSWILLGIFEKGFSSKRIIPLINVEDMVVEILGTNMINRKHLYKLLSNSSHFEIDKKNEKVKFISKENVLKNEIISLYINHINWDKLNSNCKMKKTGKINIYINELLANPISLNKIKEIINVKIDEDILFYQLLSNIGVYFRNNKLEKKENVDLNDRLEKIHILLRHMNDRSNEKYTIKYLLNNLLKAEKNSMSLRKIQFCFSNIFNKDVDLRDIKNNLNQSQLFQKTGYQKWNHNLHVRNKDIFYDDFEKSLDKILNKFDERERYIFKKRLFRDKDQKLTLKEIGEKFEVSRERIRQIAKKLMRRLYHPHYSKFYRKHFNILRKVFKENRVLDKKTFSDNILKKKYFANVDINFLINFYNKCSKKGSTKITMINNQYLIYIDKEHLDFLWERVKNELINDQRIVKFNNLLDFFGKFKIKHKSFLKDYIKNNDKAIKFKDRVLFSKDKIYIKDKIKMVLEVLDEPSHYKEISNVYNEQFNDISPHNLHSKLIDSNDFIRVEQGTYGLKNWKCEKDIYVRDLNYKVLKNNKAPMHYEEIENKVLEYKDVKENTIYAFLHDDNRIFSYSRGYFALKEWENNDEISSKHNISQWRIKASENDRTFDYYLGSCLGYNDKLISFHKIGEKYLNRNYLKISKKVVQKIDLNYNIIILDSDYNVYNVKLDQNNRRIEGIRKILEDNQIEVGDYIYLEYYKPQLLKLHTKKEYEDKYCLITKKGVKKNIMSDEALEKILDILSEDSGSSQKDFNSILQSGIENGYVRYEELMDLDYNQENIDDHFEALQILDKKNIEIIYEEE
ncbi:MAG: sigma factor-like helix-turn-helix DNA-binding protein [Bacillota bacterium]